MPLNTKGNKILAALTKEYGDKKGKSVFYAGINSGKFKGVGPDSAKKNKLADAIESKR